MNAEFLYLDDYTDESLPCVPSLEGWATWLSTPSPEWSRAEAAKAGDEFAASSLVILGDVKADLIDGKWVLATPAPEGTEIYFLRPFEGSTGWDAEHSANTVEDALGCMFDDETTVWLACVKEGDIQRVRYLTDPPRCEIVKAQA